jgi:2-hydroxychromene-2-carboxylate isomerase
VSARAVVAYFDFASPWSYLAHAIAKQKLAGHTLDWRPIYLRGLETFSKGMPYSGPKLAYLARDMVRCAEHEGVDFQPPATFPLDGLASLRGAFVAKERGAFERYADAVFRAAWAEQRDIGDRALVAGILAEATKLEPAAALAALSAQPVKDALREATEEAQRRGVFGTPSFFVGDEMFWGHDRLDYVARAAAKA